MRCGRRTAHSTAILFGHGHAHTLLPGDPEDMNKKSVPGSAAALLTLFVLPAAGCGGLLDLGPDPEGRLGMSDGGVSSSPDAATTGAPASPTGTFAPNSGAPGPENPADDSSTAAPEVVASDLDSAANATCGPVAPGLAVYRGGTVALLGSPAPFSAPDAGQNASDEESIPWPADVRGSEGSCTMFVAEIEVQPSCTAADKVW